MTRIRDFDPNGFIDPFPAADNFRLRPVRATVFDGIGERFCRRQFQLGPGVGAQSARLEVFIHGRQDFWNEVENRLESPLLVSGIGKVGSHIFGRISNQRIR